MQLIPEQPATPLSAALATIAAAEAKSKAKAKARAADNAAAKQITHRQISISMPSTLLAQIEQQADALHMPRATYVKMLLAQGVAAHAPAPTAPAPGLGVDITGATGLAGAALDAWIDDAEEASSK